MLPYIGFLVLRRFSALSSLSKNEGLADLLSVLSTRTVGMTESTTSDGTLFEGAGSASTVPICDFGVANPVEEASGHEGTGVCPLLCNPDVSRCLSGREIMKGVQRSSSFGSASDTLRQVSLVTVEWRSAWRRVSG